MVLKLYTDQGTDCCPIDPRFNEPLCPDNDILDVCECYCAGAGSSYWEDFKTWWLANEAIGTLYSNFGLGANPCAGGLPGDNLVSEDNVNNEFLDIFSTQISTVPGDCFDCQDTFGPISPDCDYLEGYSDGVYDCKNCSFNSPWVSNGAGWCNQHCDYWDPMDPEPFNFGYGSGIIDLDLGVPNCSDVNGLWSISCPQYAFSNPNPSYQWAVSVDITREDIEFSPDYNCCGTGCFGTEWLLRVNEVCPDCLAIGTILPDFFEPCCPVEIGSSSNGEVLFDPAQQTLPGFVDTEAPDCFFTENKVAEDIWEFSPLYCCYVYDLTVRIDSVVIADDAPEDCDPGSDACPNFQKNFPLEVFWEIGPDTGVIPYCISEVTMSWNNGGKKDVSVTRDISAQVDACAGRDLTIPAFGNADYICADPYVNFSFTTDADLDVPGCAEYDGDIYIDLISGTGRFRDLQKIGNEWSFRWTGSSCDPVEPVIGRIVHHRSCSQNDILCQLDFQFTPDGPTCGSKAPDATAVVDLSVADFNHIIANAPPGNSAYLIIEAIVPCENCNDACTSIGVEITGSGQTVAIMDIVTTAGALFWYCPDCIETTAGSGCDSGPSGTLGQQCTVPGTLDVTAGTSTFFRAYVGYANELSLSCEKDGEFCPGECGVPAAGLPGGSTIQIEFSLDPIGCQDCSGSPCA